MITASAARRALTRKACRTRLRRQFRAAVAAVAREEQTAAGPGEVVEVHRMPRHRPCPCLPCVAARTDPPQYEVSRTWARPYPGPARWQLLQRRVLLTDSEREQLRIHRAHLAAELALWRVLTRAPERQALLQALTVQLHAIDAKLGADRLCRIGVRDRAHYCGPPLASCLDHVTAAPRTGPPAVRPASEAPVILSP